MPTSNLALWPAIIHLVWESHPKSVLDVGPGWGKAGILLREYVDPELEVDAVEAWDGYRTPRLQAVYDTLIGADVCELSDYELQRYDLVLMIEVIEHIEKDRALKLIDRIPGEVVVCTPEEFFENPTDLPDTERHVSHWTASDFGKRLAGDHSQLGAVLVKLAARG
jgi:2-polyprenyl-3-methyl-5-hydroxy-6-metoxy-1,4-benzoquinol methylase